MPEVITYNALISACEKGKQPERALELFEAMAWFQLGIHLKPVGLLNTSGYFDQLLAFLDHAVQEKFLLDRHRSLLRIDRDPRKLVDTLIAAMDA